MNTIDVAMAAAVILMGGYALLSNAAGGYANIPAYLGSAFG